jgi:LysM repeat protein
MTSFRTRLRGLAATLTLIAFMVGVPALLIAIRAIPDPGSFCWSRLTSPDDGTLALQAIAVVCWIGWAIFTYQLIASIVSEIRGIRAPHLPGLALPQLAADHLVTAAALLFIAIPSATAFLPQPRAEAAAAATALPAAHAAGSSSPDAATNHAAPDTKKQPATESYTIRRGDSLWKIAEQRLGDGARYVELLDLNERVLGGRPDFLTPGTILKVPAPESIPKDEYVVQPGDTLSEIAEDEMGDADAYPEIFSASRSTIQPDGQRLTNPNLIRPGWHLTIPNGTPAPVTAPKHHGNLPPRTSSEAPPTETERHRSVQAAPPVNAEEDAPDTGSDLPRWVLPGLTGGGAALAGALLLVLRQHRRTQLRYRRPGRIITPPPPELRPIEKSAQASGSITAPQIELLDRALRSLRDPIGRCPRLLTATLTASEIELQLAEPAHLLLPWTGDDTTWTLKLNDAPPERHDTGAPYPTLVSIGMSQDRGLVFLNLEESRSMVIAGDAELTTALGRHIAAELSLNPWSRLVEIDTVGIAAELAEIDPLRMHHHPGGETRFLDHLASDLEDTDVEAEPDGYRVLVAMHSASDPDATRRIAKIVTTCRGRPGTAVITIGGEPDVADTVLTVTSGGRLRTPSFRQDLTAAGLTAEEALACATLVDLTRDATECDIPQPDDPTAPSDAGGALSATYVEPRPSKEAADDRSLLPAPTTVYADSAAATPDDIDTLAPLATTTAASTVKAHDPQLDEDLARWESPVLVAPKLTLLGPVTARTTGDTKQVAKRRPFYVELLAYLTLHSNGVTAPEVADAFGITKERARSDLSILRHWLGEDRQSGEPHLPDARAHRDRADHGAVYATRGVLCDLDLFRRLRTRGQADGAAGIGHLVTALRLVTGEPFSERRECGWGWLLDGERTDHIMTCAIVDVAHIITAHALAAGDFDLARFAAETAYRAAPYDETSRLDLIDVASATGHAGTAQRQLIDDVLNRSDDGLGPIDIPDRTAEVIRQRSWSSSASRSERRA